MKVVFDCKKKDEKTEIFFDSGKLLRNHLWVI